MRAKMKKGFTLIELVVVMSVSVLALGMIFSMTLSITSNLRESKISEGITSEISLIRDSVNLRASQIISGEVTISYDPATKTLSITDPTTASSVKLFYLSELTTVKDTSTNAVKISLKFSGYKKIHNFSLLVLKRT